MSLRAIIRLKPNHIFVTSRLMSGEPGSGAGKGGGSGGNVREAGGAFGKREAAQEDHYFRKLQTEQLKTIKKSHEEDVQFHEDQIEAHKKALKKHKKQLEKLDD